jgi:hypothetical protein
LHPAEIREQIKSNLRFQVPVSIGINDYESLTQKLGDEGDDSLAAIEKMIGSMLKEGDFACRFRTTNTSCSSPANPIPRHSGGSSRFEKFWISNCVPSTSVDHVQLGRPGSKRDSLRTLLAARERMFQTKRTAPARSKCASERLAARPRRVLALDYAPRREPEPRRNLRHDGGKQAVDRAGNHDPFAPVERA